jgi:ectoine hydroxylase-related dioxygenase (phytanoyl-CoA dioxygenase family)
MHSVERDGFAIVPQVVAAPTISRILDALSESAVRRTRAGIRNVLRIPAIRELATQENLLELARQVLGPGAIPYRTTLFDKSAQSNWLVVWHQDTALPLRERRDVRGWGPWSVKEGVVCAHAPASALEQVLAIRVHLDDSNEQNGPLRVLPSTHNSGVLNDDQLNALASQEAAIDCCVASGGVLLMRPLLVHASSKAKSNEPRRVLHIEYASTLVCGNGLELAVD